jgi:O-succinylbenzoate synthase
MASFMTGVAGLHQPLSFENLEILEAWLPLREPFSSALGDREFRQALLFRWTDREGHWGIGECSSRPDPYYNGEFTSGIVELLRHYIVPSLSDVQELADLRNRLQRLRAWRFTRGAILDAAIDLLERRGYRHPLSESGVALDRVPVGISIGLSPSLDIGIERARSAIAKGYRRLKFKVAPGDQQQIVLETVSAIPETPILIDANGSLDATHIPWLASLPGHVTIEQPFDPSRMDLLSVLRSKAPRIRVCLDESIEHLGDLWSALSLGVTDEVNLKPGRVGGVFEALAIRDACLSAGIAVWVGGMFETGVGRALNLRFAARIQGAVAHDLSPSSRYFEHDIVTEPARMDPTGHVTVTDNPVEIDSVALATVLKRRLRFHRA